jgi:hypothetical protein
MAWLYPAHPEGSATQLRAGEYRFDGCRSCEKNGIQMLCQRHHVAETKVLRGGERLLKQLSGHDIALFNRHGLRQIPWLVHVTTAPHGDVIGEQLQWNDRKDG